MASLDVIRKITIRAEQQGVDATSNAVSGLSNTVDTSGKRALSVEKNFAALERRFVAGAKEIQEFEKIQKTLNLAVAQFPQLAEQANSVLDAMSVKLLGVSNLTTKMIAGMSAVGGVTKEMAAEMAASAAATEKLNAAMKANAEASRAMVSGLSKLGSTALENAQANEKLKAAFAPQELLKFTSSTKSASEAMRENASASNAMIAGLSGVGKVSLENQQANAKLTAGFAAVPKTFDSMIKGMTDATNASKTMLQGMSAAGKQAETFSKSADKVGTSTKTARYELLNLSRQLQDVVVGVASGQAGFTILIQQGTQIFDAFQTSAAAGRSLGQAILGLITPTRLLVGGLALLATAGVLLALRWKNVELQFDDVSKRTNTTIESLHGLASAAAIKGIDNTVFLDAFTKLNDEVELAKKGLGSLNELFRINAISAKNLKDPVSTVAELVRKATTGAGKASVLRSAGLPDSAEFIRFFDQGAAAIKRQRAEMEQLAGAIDKGMIKKAREADEAWNKTLEKFSLGWRRVFASIFDFMSGLLAKWPNVIQIMMDNLEAGIEKVPGFGPGGLVERGLAKILPTPKPKTFDETSNEALSALAAKNAAELTDIETQKKLLELGRRRLLQNGQMTDSIDDQIQRLQDKATRTEEDLKASLKQIERERARINQLGDLKTAEDVVRLKQLELNEENLRGNGILEKQQQQVLSLAQLQDKARRSGQTVAALGEAATVTEKYGAQIDELNVKLKDGTLTQQQFNRAVFALNPAVKAVQDSISQVGSAMASAFIEGKDAAEALHASLKAVASTAASATINNLIKGDLAGAAISAAVAGTAFLADKIFGGPTAEEKAAAAQAIEAMKQADEALKNVTASFAAMTAAAEGAVTSTLKNAKAQFEQLKNSADSARAAALIIVNTPGNTPAVMAQANANIAAANKAVLDATQQLADFNLRTINDAIDNFVQTDLTPIAQGLKDLSDKAKDLTSALILTGTSAEEAANIVNEKLTKSLELLANKINTDLTRKINEASGKGWINQLTDLRAEIADLALGGGDAAKIAEYVRLTVQNLVDSSKIAGTAFADLTNMFPDLTSGVKEFSEEAVDAAEAIKNAAEIAAKAAEDAANRLATITDRAVAATIRGDDLGSQLARFDYEAQKQREAEMKAGGEDIAYLETVLAIERQNIIDDFNADALKAQQDAADKMAQEQFDMLENQINAEKERVETIKKANQDIIDYLNGLLTGSLSPLSAKAQLDAARQLYDAQLALAKSGDLTALQNITKSADTLLNASKAFYGSSLGYQRDFQLVQNQLGGVAGIPIAPMMVTNDNVAAISAAGFANVSGLLERLIELAEEGNFIIPETINGQTLILATEQRFSDRKAS